MWSVAARRLTSVAGDVRPLLTLTAKAGRRQLQRFQPPIQFGAVRHCRGAPPAGNMRHEHAHPRHRSGHHVHPRDRL